MDQCATEPSRERSDRATPPRIKASPRALTLGKLNLRGSSETTVKFLLQRKHQRGETWSKQGQYSEVFRFTGHIYDCLRSNTQLFAIFSQCVYTTAERTLMETCGIQFLERSWNASFALAPTASRTANASRVPASIHASIP